MTGKPVVRDRRSRGPIPLIRFDLDLKWMKVDAEDDRNSDLTEIEVLFLSPPMHLKVTNQPLPRTIPPHHPRCSDRD